jgi:hypothetical protein
MIGCNLESFECRFWPPPTFFLNKLPRTRAGRWLQDGDSDAEIMMGQMAAGAADYRADCSDDVDPNFDAKARPQQGPAVEIHKGIGNRIPPPGAFSRFGGPGGSSFKFPIPDSRLAGPGNRETGNPRFPIRPGIGNRGPRGIDRAGDFLVCESEEH